MLRHAGPAADVSFNDLIAAEQNLVSLIPMYLTALGAYWQAVSDMASLLQTDNVYDMAAEVENCPMPDLAKLLALPCCHPCSELPQPALKGISSFESPPGRPIAPEVQGVEVPPAPPTAAPKQSGQTPALDRPTVPPQTPVLLLPPIGVTARD